MNMEKYSKKYMIEMIVCACGCGTEISKYSKVGRLTRYVPSHQLAKSREVRGDRKGGGKKGQIPWNKGIKMSLEQRKNYTGRIESEEHKKKISKSLIGNNRALGSSGNATSFKKGQNAGANNKNWKGGISKEVWLVRGSWESTQWKKEVKKRDENTCKKCGIKSFSKTTAHHIFNFATHVDLRFSVDNGVTFCVKCHKDFHIKYGYHNNNLYQVNEFIKENKVKTIYLEDYNFDYSNLNVSYTASL